MGARERNKGAVAEREFANWIKEFGYDEARRGQQRRGGGDSPDVIGIPGVHPELKRTETFGPYAAYRQAVSDSAGSGNEPIVFHRYNRGKWMAFLDGATALKLLRYLHLT